MLTTRMLMLVYVAVLAIAIAAGWKVFQKAGEAGWKSLIPIYNDYTIACIATRDARLRTTTLVCSTVALVAAITCMGATFEVLKALGDVIFLEELKELTRPTIDIPLTVSLLAAMVGYVAKVIVNYRLAQAFGEDRAFGILLSVARPVAMLALAFDDEIEYVGAMD